MVCSLKDEYSIFISCCQSDERINTTFQHLTRRRLISFNYLTSMVKHCNFFFFLTQIFERFWYSFITPAMKVYQYSDIFQDLFGHPLSLTASTFMAFFLCDVAQLSSSALYEVPKRTKAGWKHFHVHRWDQTRFISRSNLLRKKKNIHYYIIVIWRVLVFFGTLWEPSVTYVACCYIEELYNRRSLVRMCLCLWINETHIKNFMLYAQG